jgi:transposase
VAKVVIGVDPHKRLNAVVVRNARGEVLARKQFANSAEGFGELRWFARRWRPRTWAVEGCNGVGKHLAQRLVGARERVVDVSTRRAALVRVFAGGNGRKNHDVDAHSVALVGLHTRDLAEVRKDDHSAALRLLANRRKELVDLRTQCVNRLHRDLVGLSSGGAPQALTAVKAKALLASIRPRDEMGRLRRRLAADQLADLVALDKKLAAVEAEIRAMVKRTPTGLPDIYGIGPVITATVLGEVANVARFRDRHQFASYNGTAPDDKGSTGRPVHCVNPKGNRRLNHAIHMAAITQIRNRRSPGRAYYDRKRAEAKTNNEALRCLKRRISDVVYRQLVADADRQADAGPGGQTGTTLQSSVTGPTPTTGTSDKPQPGPSMEATPTPLRAAG